MYDGLEGVRAPLLQRLGRLHVVVAVDQYGPEGRVDELLAVYDGVPVGRRDLGEVRPGFHQQDGQPLGAAPHVRLVLLLGADGRNPQQ